MSKHPPIQIVDENDNPIRAAGMDETYQKGLRHRIIHIFVEDPDGNVLLQKRSTSMATFPNNWDVSVGGHVDEGESYETAALREMQEELGISGYELQEIDSFYKEITLGSRQVKRFIKVYKTVIPADTPLKPDPDEVAEVRWFDREALKKLVAEAPNSLTDSMQGYFKKFGYL
jgi:isopentenyl-diphosphate delta-isomerase type 1